MEEVQDYIVISPKYNLFIWDLIKTYFNIYIVKDVIVSNLCLLYALAVSVSGTKGGFLGLSNSQSVVELPMIIPVAFPVLVHSPYA